MAKQVDGKSSRERRKKQVAANDCSLIFWLACVLHHRDAWSDPALGEKKFETQHYGGEPEAKRATETGITKYDWDRC